MDDDGGSKRDPDHQCSDMGNSVDLSAGNVPAPLASFRLYGSPLSSVASQKIVSFNRKPIPLVPIISIPVIVCS